MPGKRLPFDGNTPLTLLHRLHERRPGDWDTFYAIYAPAIIKLVENYGLHDSDAQDVGSRVMQALEVLLRKPFKVWDKGRFRNYVATTTRNEVLRFFKDAKKRHALSINDERMHDLDSRVPNPLDILLELEKQATVRRCLDQLQDCSSGNKRNLLVFFDYVINKMDAKAVAKKYGIKRQRVFEIRREILNRVARKLRALGEFEGDE